MLKFAEENETYLGSPVNASRPAAFQSLIQHIDNKLHAWKGRLLSPAGKLVLIKSVLESLLVYQMSSTLIHKSVLEKIQSRCLQFFWGKADGKAICFVKWEKLTRPKLEGGLGLRDLSIMNNALILKNVWKVISQNEAMWVLVMCAKYFPGSSFWHTHRDAACTRIWHAVMQNRAIMANFSRWSLGDGCSCPAFA